MKNQYQKIVYALSILIFLFFFDPLQAIHTVHYPNDDAMAIGQINFHGAFISGEETKLDWREKIALKILRKRLGKQLRKGSGNIAFPFSEPPENECVTLILKDGKRLKIQIVKMTEEKVTYRICNDPDGPEITLPWTIVKSLVGHKGAGPVVQEAREYMAKINNKPKDYSSYDDCVVIRLVDNKRIKAKITRETETAFVYKKCGEENSAEITIEKSEITYVWAKEKAYQYRNRELLAKKSGLKLDEIALMAVISTTLGVVLLPFAGPFVLVFLGLGFIMGIISIFRILLNKEKYSGLFLAILALIPGLIVFILILPYLF
ncbi:MAG: hypothetical protein KDC85_21635 [Saprospiraceae bacterium]|nr:hypothetical protein [Saprospiraceae bacterium]MCB9324372.1 hypothetical protein [Lewinellaceae bacterium]